MINVQKEDGRRQNANGDDGGDAEEDNFQPLLLPPSSSPDIDDADEHDFQTSSSCGDDDGGDDFQPLSLPSSLPSSPSSSETTIDKNNDSVCIRVRFFYLIVAFGLLAGGILAPVVMRLPLFRTATSIESPRSNSIAIVNIAPPRSNTTSLRGGEQKTFHNYYFSTNDTYVQMDPFTFVSNITNDTRKERQTHPVSSAPPLNTACSCWNDDNKKCCLRGIHANHKMGHRLTHVLFDDANKMKDVKVNDKIHTNVKSANKDYRNVYLSRNWFDALISGYLYHQTGRECWLEGDGLPSTQPWKEVAFEKTKDYAVVRFLQLPAPYPNLDGRDLCQYLIDEKEVDGMRVYAEWVMRMFYGRLLGVYRFVEETETPFGCRTLFVCFEDIVNPETKQHTIERIMDWIYPGGQKKGYHAIEDTNFTSSFEKHGYSRDGLPLHAVGGDDGDRLLVYEGSHSTSHDPELRARLYRILLQLDKEAFQGAIRRNSDLFGCGTL